MEPRREVPTKDHIPQGGGEYRRQATDGATNGEIDLNMQKSEQTGKQLMEPPMERSICTCKRASKQASN